MVNQPENSIGFPLGGRLFPEMRFIPSYFEKFFHQTFQTFYRKENFPPGLLQSIPLND